jgi:hypothetical protein
MSMAHGRGKQHTEQPLLCRRAVFHGNTATQRNAPILEWCTRRWVSALRWN